MMMPRINPVASIPKKMRTSLTLFCATHVLDQDKPVSREEVVAFLKKSGHKNAEETFSNRFLLPI